MSKKQSRQAKWREKIIRTGKCTVCGKPRNKKRSRWFCVECLEARNEKRRLERSQSRLKRLQAEVKTLKAATRKKSA